MIQCPHCAKEIDVPTRLTMPWRASYFGLILILLGGLVICTLVYITVVPYSGDESSELSSLRKELQALKAKLAKESTTQIDNALAVAPAVAQEDVLSKSLNAQLPKPVHDNLPKLQQLASGVKEAMTTESILKMEKWNRVGGGGLSSPRELAKARAGAPLFKEFYSIGENAKDTLRTLISDENEDIRRSSTLLLQQWPYLQERIDQRDIDLAMSLMQSMTIPLLEEALLHQDAEVRYYACCTLGDLTSCDDALESLYRSAIKLKSLRQDPVIEVRGIAYTACGRVLRVVSEKAKDPEVRSNAKQDHEKHFEQGSW